MLQHVFPSGYSTELPMPLDEIYAVLRDRYKIRFIFNQPLGSLNNGNKILGMFSVSPLTIRIDPCLEMWSGRFRFTLAHEIGHLSLHRDLIGKGKYIPRDKPLVDTARQLKYREMAALSDLDWVEWQANEFAMALILPHGYMLNTVVAYQHKRGVTRFLGSMRLDDQPCNIQDCLGLVSRISTEININPSMIWKRLRYLGILHDARSGRMKTAFEEMDALFSTRSG